MAVPGDALPRQPAPRAPRPGHRLVPGDGGLGGRVHRDPPEPPRLHRPPGDRHRRGPERRLALPRHRPQHRAPARGAGRRPGRPPSRASTPAGWPRAAHGGLTVAVFGGVEATTCRCCAGCATRRAPRWRSPWTWTPGSRHARGPAVPTSALAQQGWRAVSSARATAWTPSGRGSAAAPGRAATAPRVAADHRARAGVGPMTRPRAGLGGRASPSCSPGRAPPPPGWRCVVARLHDGAGPVPGAAAACSASWWPASAPCRAGWRRARPAAWCSRRCSSRAWSSMHPAVRLPPAVRRGLGRAARRLPGRRDTAQQYAAPVPASVPGDPPAPHRRRPRLPAAGRPARLHPAAGAAGRPAPARRLQRAGQPARGRRLPGGSSPSPPAGFLLLLFLQESRAGRSLGPAARRGPRRRHPVGFGHQHRRGPDHGPRDRGRRDGAGDHPAAASSRPSSSSCSTSDSGPGGGADITIDQPDDRPEARPASRAPTRRCSQVRTDDPRPGVPADRRCSTASRQRVERRRPRRALRQPADGEHASAPGRARRVPRTDLRLRRRPSPTRFDSTWLPTQAPISRIDAAGGLALRPVDDGLHRRQRRADAPRAARTR